MRKPNSTIAPLALPCILADRYDLRRRIGVGAAAEVFLGWDRELSREVAIKRLRAESELDPHEVARMKYEAQQLAAARVDPMTEIYDIQMRGSERFLVLRHIVGRSLERVIAQSGPKTAAQTLQIANDVLEALISQHRHGRVHQAPRAVNVLVDDSGRAVLLDLGDDHDRGCCTNEAADVYEVGALMFQVAFGSSPPADPHALVTVVTPGRPAAFAAVICRALAAPDARFASVEAMAYAVKRALGELAITEVPFEDVVDASALIEAAIDSSIESAIEASLDELTVGEELAASADPENESEKPTTEMPPIRGSQQRLLVPDVPVVGPRAEPPLASARRVRPRLSRGTWQRIAMSGAFVALATTTAAVAMNPDVLGEATASAAVSQALGPPPLARGSSPRLQTAPVPMTADPPAALEPARSAAGEIDFSVADASPAPRRAALPPVPATTPPPRRVVQIPARAPARQTVAPLAPASVMVRAPDDSSTAALGAYAEQLARNGANEAAIAAGRRYLRVAPDGAEAPRVRALLSQLEIASR